jgi:hypothetical protein
MRQNIRLILLGLILCILSSEGYCGTSDATDKYVKGKGVVLHVYKNPVYSGGNFSHISYINDDCVDIWLKKKIFLKEGINFLMVDYRCISNFVGLLFIGLMPDFTGEKTINFQYGADNWYISKNKILLKFYAESGKEYFLEHFIPGQKKSNPDIAGDFVIREVGTKKIISKMINQYKSKPPKDAFFGGNKNLREAYIDAAYINDFTQTYKNEITDSDSVNKFKESIDNMQASYGTIYKILDGFPSKFNEKSVDKFIELYKEMVNQKIDTEHALYQLAFCYGLKKDYNAAVDSVKPIIEQNPSAYWAKFTYSGLLQQMKEKEKAKEMAAEAQKISDQVSKDYIAQRGK